MDSTGIRKSSVPKQTSGLSPARFNHCRGSRSTLDRSAQSARSSRRCSPTDSTNRMVVRRPVATRLVHETAGRRGPPPWPRKCSAPGRYPHLGRKVQATGWLRDRRPEGVVLAARRSSGRVPSPGIDKALAADLSIRFNGGAAVYDAEARHVRSRPVRLSEGRGGGTTGPWGPRVKDRGHLIRGDRTLSWHLGRSRRLRRNDRDTRGRPVGFASQVLRSRAQDPALCGGTSARARPRPADAPSDVRWTNCGRSGAGNRPHASRRAVSPQGASTGVVGRSGRLVEGCRGPTAFAPRRAHYGVGEPVSVGVGQKNSPSPHRLQTTARTVRDRGRSRGKIRPSGADGRSRGPFAPGHGTRPILGPTHARYAATSADDR
jgi:hypothetical protein